MFLGEVSILLSNSSFVTFYLDISSNSEKSQEMQPQNPHTSLPRFTNVYILSTFALSLPTIFFLSHILKSNLETSSCPSSLLNFVASHLCVLRLCLGQGPGAAATPATASLPSLSRTVVLSSGFASHAGLRKLP